MAEAMNESGNEPASKHDLALVRGELKAEFGALKTEFGGLKTEFGGLRAEFAQLRDDIREMIRPITITLANHTAELADIRGHLKDKMVTREEFHSRMDGFTGKVQDYEYGAAKNRELLVDYDRRIKALEERRAA